MQQVTNPEFRPAPWGAFILNGGVIIGTISENTLPALSQRFVVTVQRHDDQVVVRSMSSRDDAEAWLTSVAPLLKRGVIP